MQVVATKDDGLEELKINSPPSVLFVGQLQDFDEILIIVAEGEVLFNVSGGHLSALKCLIAVYYTLNFCYAKGCTNTYTFLQKHVLQIFDLYFTPVKVKTKGVSYSKLHVYKEKLHGTFQISCDKN